MNRKGIIAILDGLAAYTIAFVCIGMVALLLANGQQANTKSARTLNLWSEDIADAIGMSMVDPYPNNFGKGWFKDTDHSIKSDLEISLENIAIANGIAINASIDGVWSYSYGNVNNAERVATAKRVLMDYEVVDPNPAVSGDEYYNATGDVVMLTVKVGA